MSLKKIEAEIKMRQWASERHKQGLKLPASPQRPSNPALSVIASEVGISRISIARQGQQLRQVLDELISIYGLEVEWSGDRFKSNEVHLHLAKSLAMDHYARECHETSTYFDPIRQLLDRLFNILIKRAGGDSAAVAKEAIDTFRADIERNAVRAADGYVPYLDTILELIAAEMARTSLPDEFAARLCLVLGRAGLSRSQAAAMFDINQGTFNSWCSGDKRPDRSFWPSIKNLEVKLGLATGTLVDVIIPGQKGKGRFRSELFPAELRAAEKANLRSEIGRQMPSDFFERPVNEQMLLLAAKAKDIEVTVLKRKAWYDLRHDSYALKDYPEALEAQVEALFRFKARGEPITNFEGKLIYPLTSWKTEDTIETMDRRLRAFFGYLIGHAPPHLRVHKEEACLVHLLDVEAISSYLRFKSDRQIVIDGEPRLTPTDMDLVTFAAALASEADGFIRHSPTFVQQVLHILSKTHRPESEDTRREALEFAHSCGLAYDNLKRLERSFRGKTSKSHKHHERMKPLLSNEAPLALVYDRIDGLENEIAKLVVGSNAYWQTARTIFMLHFFAQMPLRADTIVALDYSLDNKGHLRQIDGNWTVVVPVKLFKNSASKRFSDGEDFEKILEDVHGAYQAIVRYVSQARPYFLKGVQSNALFVSSARNPRFSEKGLANVIYRTTDRLFGKAAEDGDQIEGLEAFSAHGFRDIVATAVLKATGSYELAADAIQDAPATVQKRYAQWMPSDRKQDLHAAFHAARSKRKRV